MAFGVKREELQAWKRQVQNGEVAFLTHFWIDDRFPGCDTVTKAGCSDLDVLKEWGSCYDLHPGWIHLDPYPHFDLFGDKQYEILKAEGRWDHIERFALRRKET
ncbi:hypothetical protein JF544_04810 [Halobacillus kuroshimensis]|uniref:Uncharacterized protein n=1 Tax=Halobacillus kuroshimensis TaxID=302481 RepID=A0ABS3DT91_9BACI|nr:MULTISPECIES: hypothetical protein [Halobacillus]MBN8234556.1 hypothetical protein [Halobacillus kuroshimensis]